MRNYEKLIESAQNGNLEGAKTAISKGADVNAKIKSEDYKGYTPLHLAAKNGHLEVVKLLIDKGAVVNAKDDDGKTPLHYASTAEVANLLFEKGADVYTKDNDGGTPLHYASSAEVAKLLIEKFDGFSFGDVWDVHFFYFMVDDGDNEDDV